ncbi:choice-of-anchor G family protein, partial [Schumannella luteola]
MSGERTPRRLVAMLAAGGLAVALVGTTVTASSAAWTDQEWDGSTLGSLDCTASGIVDSRAWGRVLSGEVTGTSLDPVLATDGITVDNVAPASTSTGTSQAAPVTDLGADAWSAGLGVSALSSLDLGAGVILPLDAGTGTYTQFGRATSGGMATGAAGAVTSAAGGLVSIDTPTGSTPRLGTLRLSDVLDSVLPGLGTPVSRLADVDLEVGAVASIADLDGCALLWDPASLGTSLDREYLVAALRLALTGDVVAGFGVSLDATLGTLQSELDARLTQTVDAAVVSSVASLLTTALAGIGGIAVDPAAVTVAVGGSIDLAPVRALLASDITDGVVTVNLASGRVSADLAALLGDAYADGDGLNGRDPNTSVLQPAVLDALLDRLSAVIADFVTNTIQPAISQAVLGTAITVTVVSLLDATVTVVVPVTVPQIIQVRSVVSGSIGGFTGA